MRFLVIGAGAVGAVLGISLEHQKHDVLYLLRQGRKKKFQNLILVDAATGVARKRDTPFSAELGAPLPPYEWVLLCVRGEQLDEGIETMAAHVRPDAAVGVASAALDDLARVRAAHPNGPVFTIMPTFSAWSAEPNVWKWFTPPLVPTLLSGEGDVAADAAAREMEKALVAAGVKARAVSSVKAAQVPMMSSGMALLAGWELCGWDADALGKNDEVRNLTAQAMREAAKVAAAESEERGEASTVMKLLSAAPAGALSLVLRALPHLASANLRAMWHHHGPKIAAQTRDVLDGVLRQAEARGIEAPRLRELRGRLQTPAP